MSDRRDEKGHRECYEDIVKQIEREDGLINFRLQWMLQLNGFLFAALALVVGKEVDPSIKTFFAIALPTTGLLVSVAGFVGVIAAHFQLTYLTDLWREGNYAPWPRPFGDERAFRLGQWPSFFPPLVLAVVWLVLLVQNILARCHC